MIVTPRVGSAHFRNYGERVVGRLINPAAYPVSTISSNLPETVRLLEERGVVLEAPEGLDKFHYRFTIRPDAKIMKYFARYAKLYPPGTKKAPRERQEELLKEFAEGDFTYTCIPYVLDNYQDLLELRFRSDRRVRIDPLSPNHPKVIGELVVNSIEHGSKCGKRGGVTVEILGGENGILTTIEDGGKGHDYRQLQIPPPESIAIEFGRDSQKITRGVGLVLASITHCLVSAEHTEGGFRTMVYYPTSVLGNANLVWDLGCYDDMESRRRVLVRVRDIYDGMFGVDLGSLGFIQGPRLEDMSHSRESP